MPYISSQELIGGLPNASPEFVNLVKWFYATFDNNGAGNRTITNVETLFYIGNIALSEFTVYAATKLYLVLSFDAIIVGAGTQIATSYITTYDEANAANMYFINQSIAWDATAAAFRYLPLNFDAKNLYFSRIAPTILTAMKFIGYRITLA